MCRSGIAPVTPVQTQGVLSRLALELPPFESQNYILRSVPWSIFFPLNFFSLFSVYMNCLNPSRGESMFIFAEALPGEVLFV